MIKTRCGLFGLGQSNGQTKDACVKKETKVEAHDVHPICMLGSPSYEQLLLTHFSSQLSPLKQKESREKKKSPHEIKMKP